MSPIQVISFGRDANNDVPFIDPTVSNWHCQIARFDDGTFSIVDLGSSNGTFVNGNCIYGEYQLHYQDSVRIGKSELYWQRYFPMNQFLQPDVPPCRDFKWLLVGIGSALLVVLVVLILALSGVFDCKKAISGDGNIRSHDEITTEVPDLAKEPVQIIEEEPIDLDNPATVKIRTKKARTDNSDAFFAKPPAKKPATVDPNVENPASDIPEEKLVPPTETLENENPAVKKAVNHIGKKSVQKEPRQQPSKKFVDKQISPNTILVQ